MERRELLKMMAMTVGGSVALPKSAFARIGEAFNPADLTYFRPAQREQVAILAEAIIPETDTPGAIEAGVPGWIELITKDCLAPEDQLIITEGLAAIMLRCAKDHGKGLDKLSAEEQVAFLTVYDEETKATRAKLEQQGKPQRQTFLQQFKELTKFCYVNSEVGATQAFDYHLVPGKWVPDMPLKPGMKAYSI
jgi:gluconate 2-dehydrogenase gamma chain